MSTLTCTVTFADSTLINVICKPVDTATSAVQDSRDIYITNSRGEQEQIDMQLSTLFLLHRLIGNSTDNKRKRRKNVKERNVLHLATMTNNGARVFFVYRL